MTPGRCFGLAWRGAVVSLLLLAAGCLPSPTAVDFIASPTEGPRPLVVAFSARVTGAASGYTWSFGDGEGSTAPSPSHTYAEAGTYAVSFTVETPSGPVTARKPDFIRATVGTEGAYVFWIERGSGQIHRVPLGGGPSETIVRGLIGPEDLAVSGGRVYWTDPGAGTVESADLDGANRRTIASGENYPTGVTVDGARSKVYWTTLPSAVDASPVVMGAIKRAHLDGAGVETLASFAPGALFAWQIVVDGGASRLYWMANDWAGVGTSSRAATCHGRIMTSGLDARSPVTFIEGLCGPTDLTLGGTGPARLYWTDEDAGTVSRIGADGSGRTVLVSGQTGAESVAVSPSAGKVYWVAGSLLLRANLDGSGVEAVAAGLDLPEGVAVGG